MSQQRQSITNASVSQPSRPPHIRHRSVAPRSSGAVATGGSASIRGGRPIARLCTERTQGSYKVELMRKTGLAAKAWEMIYPKRLLLSKTDVARYGVTWACQPHSVCSGRQKNIAAFGKTITQAWAKDPQVFDIEYFKRLVAMAILTKADVGSYDPSGVAAGL